MQITMGPAGLGGLKRPARLALDKLALDKLTPAAANSELVSTFAPVSEEQWQAAAGSAPLALLVDLDNWPTFFREQQR